jgi:pyruvate dehydrogenase E2 component (dihydrolipoamide acetyltransferase)
VAVELGIDWRQSQGTGASGRVREADVRRAAASHPHSVSAATTQQYDNGNPAAVEVVPHTPRRRTIAQRMLASRQQTAPVTLTTRADATNLVALRQQFKVAGGIVPTYADIAAKLTALALLRHPELSGRWCNDHLELPPAGTIDISLAVDVPEGLVAPLIRDVARCSLVEVARQSQRLVELARSNRLTTADMVGGVFTITNLGHLGIDAFTPSIQHPQTAILGLGAIRREPVVLAGDAIAVRDMITLSLTFDHRAVDGAPAARFFQTLCSAFVSPSAWLISLEGQSPRPLHEQVEINRQIHSS